MKAAALTPWKRFTIQRRGGKRLRFYRGFFHQASAFSCEPRRRKVQWFKDAR